MTTKNYFEILNSINVSDKIEKKNGLSYLSWAYAWGEVKKLYPKAEYKVYETNEGCIYWTDSKTCWVKTGVIIENVEHIEYLPVMDFRNKSIALKDITSFEVNKAIQRSLTKAIARHGLGLYIYAGEDLPEGEEKPEQKTPLQNLGESLDEDMADTLFGYLSDSIQKCQTLDELEALKGTKDFKQSYTKLGKIDKKQYDLIGTIGANKKAELSEDNGIEDISNEIHNS